MYLLFVLTPATQALANAVLSVSAIVLKVCLTRAHSNSFLIIPAFRRFRLTCDVLRYILYKEY